MSEVKRPKLTDKQKKKILADYAINQNKSETARMNNVSEYTVRSIVKNYDKDVSIKIEEKKEQNTKDILDYMDSIVDDQKEVIRLSLKALKEKLKKPDMFTNVKDIATVYGVVYDKALKSKELKLRSQELEKGNKDIEDLTVLADMLGFNKKDNK